MKKILLIGRGPLPSPKAPQLGFSQLRTRAFYQALIEAGHNVRLLLLVPGTTTQGAPTSWGEIISIQEEGPNWINQGRSLKVGADIIVSAGPYNPGRLATAIADDEALWVDIPGDPLAELSALSMARARPLDDAEIAAAYSGAVQVLARADALSVISTPQLHATWGQLGLMGRLLNRTTTPCTHVVPITHDWSLPEGTPRAPSPGTDTVIALSGAFNPWFDADRLVQALELAFQMRKDLRVVCTGGGIPGFYESSYKRFVDWSGRYPNRVELHGWLPHEQMATVLRGAHAGLSIDCPGVEPVLGSRTRLLLFAHLGLQCVSTVRCALSQDWAARGALYALDNRDPIQMGHQLAQLQIEPTMGLTAQHLAKTDFHPRAIMQPLIAWCAEPVRTASTRMPEAVLAAELDANRDELARVYGSSTWQALNRVHTLGAAAMSRLKGQSG